MAVAYEIPLIAENQTFAVTLAGVQYNFQIIWNAQSGTWIMDIADVASAPLLCGVPLVAGYDILAQYPYVGIGGQMIVQSDNDLNADPTYDNLGATSHLFFISATGL